MFIHAIAPELQRLVCHSHGLFGKLACPFVCRPCIRLFGAVCRVNEREPVLQQLSQSTWFHSWMLESALEYKPIH